MNLAPLVALKIADSSQEGDSGAMGTMSEGSIWRTCGPPFTSHHYHHPLPRCINNSESPKKNVYSKTCPNDVQEFLVIFSLVNA